MMDFPERGRLYLLCRSGWRTACTYRAELRTARALFERCSLAERSRTSFQQYDPHARRQLGNFPQAFSHVALVNTARILAQG